MIASPATIDRAELAAEHIGTARRMAVAWCRRTDRAWFRDEAESAAGMGLLNALARWEGEGRFTTLLYACVRHSCLSSLRGRGGASTFEDADAVGLVPDPSESVESRAEWAETKALALAAWRSIEARDGVRKGDRIRLARLVFGLPDSRRGGRQSYALPATIREAAKKVGRSPKWAERTIEEILDEIRAAINGPETED